MHFLLLAKCIPLQLRLEFFDKETTVESCAETFGQASMIVNQIAYEALLQHWTLGLSGSL